MVGAQNAGKSSLINRLSKRYGGPGPADGGPLASHLPGTTLGAGGRGAGDGLCSIQFTRLFLCIRRSSWFRVRYECFTFAF